MMEQNLKETKINTIISTITSRFAATRQRLALLRSVRFVQLLFIKPLCGYY